MFKFVALFTTILACIQLTFGSNIHGGSLASAPTIISGQYGYGPGPLANSIVSRNLAVPIISSYSTSIVHPNSAVLRPTIRSYIPAHQQYVSAPLTQQIHASPLISQGIYGPNANSYAVQRSYTGSLAASGYSAPRIFSSPVLASAPGSSLVHGLDGISAHSSAW
ncbi:uncharacterized protein LOC129909355 [Episyrphus balteatus]|uniref:uncharacterized protein LOC129909355 n=1 Tax=Episyrphus balteatus TaxID=286459 RepID=UPI0024869F20|nr:uncharacterized protein LOC129909355 [Episyrphus balteatus]